MSYNEKLGAEAPVVITVPPEQEVKNIATKSVTIMANLYISTPIYNLGNG